MAKKTSKEILKNRHKYADIYKMSKGCEICGYNKLPYNLCFDHSPQFEKSKFVKNANGKSNGGGMYRLYHNRHSPDELISEIKKCRILCHHCHTEITRNNKNGRSIDNIEERIESIDELRSKIVEFENETE